MGKKKLILIIFVGFFLRLINLNFPNFSTEEARIAFRGYTLVAEGKDELGRSFPLIFNSLEDYQLPITSYLTAGGILFFGKSDLGVRLPFILIGTFSIWLTYLVASIFNTSQKFRLFAAFIVAFSPVLIFLSRVPNETILLTFFFLLLFYVLTRENFNLSIIIVCFILLLLTSKIAWFTLFPFTAFSLFFLRRDLSIKSKLAVGISLLLTLSTIFIFLRIPQSVRSLMENNFPIFSDITIKNGINILRGQGIESGWPPFLERILFNKTHFLFIGFLHWLSNLQPSIFFSQFDESGKFGLVNLGAWQKILIIPLIVSLFHIIRKGSIKLNLLSGYFLIFTYPLLFIYPHSAPNMLVPFLPLMSLIIAFGITNLGKRLGLVLSIIMILEVIVNLSFLQSQIKNTNSLRPIWIKKIVEESFFLSQKQTVALSDDITSDIIPFFELYTPIKSISKFSQIDFPYKFRQYEADNIKLIGSDNKFRSCGKDEKVVLVLSNRDLSKVQSEFDIHIEKTYQDSLNENTAYRLKSSVCIN